MIKTFKEVNDRLRKERNTASEFVKTLKGLKAESANNGGEHIEAITVDLCALCCWIEKLTITIETNEKLGKKTEFIPITPVTTIMESAKYLPKL